MLAFNKGHPLGWMIPGGGAWFLYWYCLGVPARGEDAIWQFLWVVIGFLYPLAIIGVFVFAVASPVSLMNGIRLAAGRLPRGTSSRVVLAVGGVVSAAYFAAIVYLMFFVSPTAFEYITVAFTRPISGP